MTWEIILPIALLCYLVGAAPFWPGSREADWRYYALSVIGVILIPIVLVVALHMMARLAE